MKFVLAIVALGALIQDGVVSGFSAFQQAGHHSFRPRSSLSMNVQANGDAKIVKVGVIGMGRIGLVHLEAITKAPGVVPVIVSNPTVSKAEAGAYILGKW
jgi:myo-inositol 2-dehydrogenase/D-chiro-inositol 1-dehydrogenase